LDAYLLAPGAWDASADAPRDAAADVEHPRRPAQPDVDAGKLAGPERDAQGRDEHRRSALRLAQQVLWDAATEPCRRDAAPSVGRSFAAQGVAEVQQPGAQAAAAQSPAAARMRSPAAAQKPEGQ